eukprot:Polyplicarium_translucidae@DN3351_c2_g1_i2.p2
MWDMEEIVTAVLIAYRSTPHPATGETPHYLMTGCDFVLPHFQDWTGYGPEEAAPRRRFEVMTEIRRQCLDRMLRLVAARRGDSTTKALEIGDLVIVWLNPNECRRLLERFGTTRLMPRWSEPCRVTGFRGGNPAGERQ